MELVVPTTERTLKNTATGETYYFRKVEEAHPPKVEFLEVDMPNGEKTRAMCLSTKDGYAVYFQGIQH